MDIHKLYAELAASLVRMISGCWESNSTLPGTGAYIGDMGHQSEFGRGLTVLYRLDVVTFGDKLTMDFDRVPAFVDDRSRSGQIMLPPFDDVLDAWLSLADWAGHISLYRVPFTPHDTARPIMNMLAELGYAKAFGNAFVWSDKIGPAMLATGYWDENYLSRRELTEREVDLEMRAAFASIPEEFRLAALRGDETAVVKALAARWADGAWLPDSVYDASWWRWADLAPAAKRLVELVRGAGNPPTLDVN